MTQTEKLCLLLVSKLDNLNKKIKKSSKFRKKFNSLIKEKNNFLNNGLYKN